MILSAIAEKLRRRSKDDFKGRHFEAPLIERRLRSFRKPHCGSIRIDETYIKIRSQNRLRCRSGRAAAR